VVVGTTEIKEFEEILDAFEAMENLDICFDKLAIDDEKFLMPGKWPKKNDLY
jgi:hypothetical protein